MNDKSADKYSVPGLYPVNINPTDVTVSFGLPTSIASQSVYTDYELMRFLNYQLTKTFSDAETAKDYSLYTKGLPDDELFRLLANSQDNLVQTIASVRNIFGKNVDQLLENGNFWRYLVNFPDDQKFGLESSEARIYTSANHHESHAVVEHRNNKAIVRIKASTLDQLEDLFGQIQILVV